MRRHWRLLMVMGFLAVCLARSSWLSTWLQRAEHSGIARGREPVTLSQTYVLENSRWLEFQLPASSQLVWVLTTANFPESVVTSAAPEPAQRGAVYAIEYEFLGAGSEALLTGNYYFRVQPPTAQQASNLFYSAPGLLPGSGQSMRQPFASRQSRPSRLRLRLADHDTRIRDVSVRVYCQNELRAYKLAHAWRRTSRSEREKRARASVYGLELLTEYERRNLVRTKWLPVAPAGFEGRDYTRRILYSRVSQVDSNNILELPAGLLVDATTPGVIPLPDGPGEVRLELTPVAHGEDARTAEIEVRWFGSRVEQRDAWYIDASTTPIVWERELDGGLLEVATTGHFGLRAMWLGAAGSEDFEEITPEPNLLRAYVVSPQQAVEYAVEHVRDQATPLKLTFRQLLPLSLEAGLQNDAIGPARIQWSYLSPSGDVVDRGYFEFQEALSRYDRLSGTDGSTRLTDAAVRYFAVPPGVKTVRIDSPNAGLVVSAFSRPPDVIPVTFVPEDYSAFHRKQGWRKRWFLLRPVNHLQLINELRTVTVVAQPRPREVDEQRLAGLYQWESFQPSGLWKGRQLLVAREPRLPLRWESQASAFYELQTDVDYELPLLSEPGHRSVAPNLVCQTEGPLLTNLSIYVNGRLHQEVRLRSRLAEIRLKALPAQHDDTTRLRIETEGEVRVLMNRILHRAKTVFFKRMVHRLEGRTLQFEYEKQSGEEELLSLTLFHTASRQRARLRVNIVGKSIRAAEPRSDWTLLDRLYEFRSTAGPSIPVFATSGELVFEQPPCFMRLGRDLPPGHYTVKVTREDERAGYVLLSRTTSGLSERRGLARENEAYSEIETSQHRRK